MTQIWQLLVFVGAIAGLVGFGFYRDKREHRPKPKEEQTSIYFPEHQEQTTAAERHQGAAMSRLS